MTEQEKLERVSGRLEEVIAEATYPDRPRQFMMPLGLAEEALELLKSQAPRLLTPDMPPAEWQDNVIWLEIKGRKPVPCLFRKCSDLMMFGRYERLMYFDVVGSSRYSGYMLKNYGIKWRCWTSCPTDTQREATPWRRN